MEKNHHDKHYPGSFSRILKTGIGEKINENNDPGYFDEPWTTVYSFGDNTVENRGIYGQIIHE